MAQRVQPRPQVSAWAVGFTLFAGVIMVMAGIFQAILGLEAIIDDRFYVVSSNRVSAPYVYEIDTTKWGWIHLGVGIVVGLAGLAIIITGAVWARFIGVIMAALSAIANFFFIPYYPWWSLLVIALDVFVIWALCVYGKRDREAREAFGDR